MIEYKSRVRGVSGGGVLYMDAERTTKLGSRPLFAEELVYTRVVYFRARLLFSCQGAIEDVIRVSTADTMFKLSFTGVKAVDDALRSRTLMIVQVEGPHLRT